MQQITHYFLHFLFPLIVALGFYNRNWLKIYTIFLLTMLVDLDHLLADPIFEPCRCSIGFHPLHSFTAIIVYAIFLLFPGIRVIAIGLLMHMATDQIDCIFSRINCV